MRRIGIGERRARLGRRHRLAGSAKAASPVEVAGSLVALHSTDPGSVFVSVHARTDSVGIETIERALYDERTLLRLLGMRRTMFVVPVDFAPVIQAACATAIAVKQRQTYGRFLAEAGIGDEVWLKAVAEATALALAARGEAYGSELSEDVPSLRTQITLADGKSYASTQNVTTWVLFTLAAEGRIVRGRPRGSWTSSQWRWAPVEAWLPAGIPDLAAETARAELVRAWLATFGPGTVTDLKWWTGWTVGHVKQALAEIDVVDVDLGGGPGFVLADDVEPTAAPEPWVALLPALDPTAMGWSEREWYVGDNTPLVFDRSGNIAPTVWSDGRIVGGWAQRESGEIVYRLVEDIGSEATAAVDAAADRLTRWIGPARLAPRTRLRPPLEQELVS